MRMRSGPLFLDALERQRRRSAWHAQVEIDFLVRVVLQ